MAYAKLTEISMRTGYDWQKRMQIATVIVMLIQTESVTQTGKARRWVRQVKVMQRLKVSESY